MLCEMVTVLARWIHQRHRDGSHAEGLTIARAGEDDIFHPRAAQTLGGLFAQNPAYGITQIRFSTAVGANDGCDARTGKFHLGPIKEGLEALDLNSLQFQQSTAPSYYHLSGGPYYITREAMQSKAGGRRYLVGQVQGLLYVGSRVSSAPGFVDSDAIVDIIATLSIWRLDDSLKARLRVRAAHHGRSMEEEARQILKAELQEEPKRQENLAESIRRIMALAGRVELAFPRREPVRRPPDFTN